MAKTVYLLVGTKKGAFIFSSTLQRKSWKLQGPLLKGAEVNDVVMDTRNGKTLYAAATSYWWGSNVHMSKNLGKTWVQSEGGVRFHENAGKKVERVWAVSPGREIEPKTMYAGVDPGALFKSEDGGKNWAEAQSLTNHPTREKWSPGAGGLMVHSICLHPENSKKMFVGISAAGVFATEDGGSSWQPRNKNVLAEFLPDKYPEVGQCVHHLEIHPDKPEVLYQQNHCGVYRSDNEGRDWTDISKGLPSRFGFSMQIHPHNPDTVYVIPEEGAEFRAVPKGRMAVYRSTNRGKTWQKLTKGLPSKNAFLHVHRQAMKVDRLYPHGMYVGTSSGQIYYSRNEGKTWSLLADYLPTIYSLNVAGA
ncbi:MAG: exo-alpha-sialidase [Ignavibacteriales bacterium]|nr:exo-alpha-sialidase [Ignavibacteriales bacterium]